ncbi:hypothetical protein IWQ61_005363 [Dispira simplex]|nr:hypothetical protein IWQ61_005363 [Dispira simplex]
MALKTVILVLSSTVYDIPTVSPFIVLYVLYQIGSIWITFAIFWQLFLSGISPMSTFLSPTELNDDRILDLQQQSLELNHHYHSTTGNEKRSFSRLSFSRGEHIGMHSAILRCTPMTTQTVPSTPHMIYLRPFYSQGFQP